MFVFDTSAFINGWRDHYPPATFPGVWGLIAAGLEDGRIVAPREVFREIERMDDEVFEWARARSDRFVDPTIGVQGEVGAIYAQFPKPGVRDAADPWVIAEARVRNFIVVTYEGRAFSGEALPSTARKMPGICAHFGIPCVPLPDAIGGLGGHF